MSRVSTPYRVSALYRTHAALGARWTEDGGWRVPETFGDSAAEAQAARRGVGLVDASPLGKVDVVGRGAAELLGRAGAKADVGRTTVFALGGHHDLRALRLTPEHFLLLTPSGAADDARGALQRLAGGASCVHVTDVTSAFAALTLVGPDARATLAKLTALDLRDGAFPDGACAQTGLAKVPALVVREDWPALPAYRVLVGREVGEYVWEAVTEATGNTLVPVGRAAERALRGSAS